MAVRLSTLHVSSMLEQTSKKERKKETNKQTNKKSIFGKKFVQEESFMERHFFKLAFDFKSPTFLPCKNFPLYNTLPVSVANFLFMYYIFIQSLPTFSNM